MDRLKILLNYFPTGTTEGERHILKRAFVQAEEYSDLVTPPPYSPRVLVGKKGSGKSAVIEFSMSLFKRARVPAILLKPMDFELSSIPEAASVGEITRRAYLELCRAVAGSLGSNLSGLVNGDDKALYEQAVKDGTIERDAVGALARLLPRLAKPYTEFDLSALLPNTDSEVKARLERSIKANLEQSDVGFYLFIDDTDQVAAPDRPGHLNRIWGFLLAARELCQKVPSLRCIVSVREEVWRRLTSDRAGQRDQTDHFQGLVKNLNPTREHIRKIVEKRIVLAATELGERFSDPWLVFFEGSAPHIPTSNERSSWIDLVVVRSRERPRDAVQLINVLAQNVTDNRGGDEKITEADFAIEMVDFSRKRVQLLAQEAEFECPDVEEVIRSFAELDYDHGSFKATSENIKDHLVRLGGRAGISLYGRKLSLNDEDDMFQLWKFLFEVGFLNARVADNRQKDGYRHLTPREEPNLVSKSRWNLMQGIVWEVGPAYRDFLLGIEAERRARVGLPPSGRRKRR